MRNRSGLGRLVSMLLALAIFAAAPAFSQPQSRRDAPPRLRRVALHQDFVRDFVLVHQSIESPQLLGLIQLVRQSTGRMTAHVVRRQNQPARASGIAQIHAAEISLAKGKDRVHATAPGCPSAGAPRASHHILPLQVKRPRPCPKLCKKYRPATLSTNRTHGSNPYKKTQPPPDSRVGATSADTCGTN